jgi:catalase
MRRTPRADRSPTPHATASPQAGTLVRDVMNDEQRDRLVDNVIGHLLDGVTEPVLQRVFDYFRNVDVDLGDRIENGVRSH